MATPLSPPRRQGHKDSSGFREELRAITLGVLLPLVIGLAMTPLRAQQGSLDQAVRVFLEKHRGTWHDLNVPETDGRTMHDLIIKRGYTRALEIGTSTGHSGIWIAWALSKTGGKLITVEIDKTRHEQAVRNFQAAGVAPYIDARLGDAHELVPKLAGPFDFVFCDADKDWYVNYLKAVLPKLEKGGCFAAHNVSGRGWGWTREYWDFVTKAPELATTVDPLSPAGLTLSFRR